MESHADDGLIRGSVQWEPDQLAWLRAEAKRRGVRSIAAVARIVVREAMNAEQAEPERRAS